MPVTHAGRHEVRSMALAASLIALLALVLLVALSRGIVQVDPSEALSILFGGPARRVSSILVLDVRLPRFLVGALSGAALAATGCLMQAALKNDLADPGLLGVSSGASLAVAAAVVLDLDLSPEGLAGLAMLGGFAAGLLILFCARATRDPVRIILIGAALSALFGSLIMLLLVLGSSLQIQSVFAYLVGSLTGRDWTDVRRLSPWLVVCLPLTALIASRVNLLRLGEDVAEGLGVKVFRTRLLAFILAIGILAPVIATCGPIGFIALLAPHLARAMLRSGDLVRVLPIAMLAGACLLSAGDVVARQVATPLELPVGLAVTAIGAPATILLLRRHMLARAAV